MPEIDLYRVHCPGNCYGRGAIAMSNWASARLVRGKDFAARVLTAFSFVAELSLGLVVASLAHLTLGPPPIISGIISGDRPQPWVVEIPLSGLQRWVLLVTALALVRILHSYLLLRARGLRSVLLSPEGSFLQHSLQLWDLIIKSLIVVILALAMFYIWNPVDAKWVVEYVVSNYLRSIDSHYSAQTVRTILEQIKYEKTFGSLTILIILLVPSLFIYIPLLAGEVPTYLYLRRYRETSADHALLYRTFRNWTMIDLLGIIALAALLGLIYYSIDFAEGTLVSVIGSLETVQIERYIARLRDAFQTAEIPILGVTAILTALDYLVNMKFYSCEIDA
jgi:hypothetical protein